MNTEGEIIESTFLRSFELDGITETVKIESGIDTCNTNFYRVIFADGRIMYLILNDDTEEWEDREHGPTAESIAVGNVICDYNM